MKNANGNLEKPEIMLEHLFLVHVLICIKASIVQGLIFFVTNWGIIM